MESRAFIKAAAALTNRINDFALVSALANGPDDDASEGDSIQKQINQTFSGLQNPTLPSAGKLRDAATKAGFDIDPRVLHRLQEAERCWGN